MCVQPGENVEAYSSGQCLQTGHVPSERASVPESGHLGLGPGSGCDSGEIPSPLWASVSPPE